MKTAVLIPDRGTRPRFLSHLLNQLLPSQTIQPDIVELVTYPPETPNCDITQRYRRGYGNLKNRALDCILFLESDDYYAPNYIQETLSAWENAGKPDLFGQRSTIYYHLKQRGHFTMHHEQRSSAMSTLIKPDLSFPWCPDSEPYTDVWLYSKLQYKLFAPSSVISIGIKHGDGMTGGGSHVDRLERYRKAPATTDDNWEWLKANVDPVSFEFYKNYFANSDLFP